MGRVKLTENVSAVDAFVTSERIAVPRLVSMEDSRNLHPKEKVLEVVRNKVPKPHKMCHWGPSIWGHLRWCQTTVTPKMVVMLMKSYKKPQELCHCRHLPLGPRIQRLQSIMKCIARRFGNLAMETAEKKSFNSSTLGMGSTSSLMLCSHMDPWVRNAPMSVSSEKSCFSVTFPVCSACQKLEVCTSICQASSPVRHLQ